MYCIVGIWSRGGKGGLLWWLAEFFTQATLLYTTDPLLLTGMNTSSDGASEMLPL